MGDEVVVKRGPGRPKKHNPPPDPDTLSDDQVREIVKQKKRGSTFPTAATNGSSSVEEMRDMMRSVLRWYGKPKVKSDEECAERLEDFFNTLAENGELPTVEKMWLALGIEKTTLWNWEHGIGCSETRASMIQQAKSILSALDVELVNRNKQPVVSYIFRAKNYYGMKDQTDVVVTPNNPIGAEVPEDELRKRIAGDVVVDAEFTE